MIVKICAILLGVFALFILTKNQRTCNQHSTICNAIFNYKMHCIRNDCIHFDVDYHDMESYGKTLFRFWDWGYTRILPPEKFDIIKPFIGPRVSINFASGEGEE